MTRNPLVRLYDDEAVVDNFAGGGGASTGIEMAIGRSPDVAINHDKEALAMHAANHPTTRHMPDDVFKVDPVEALGGRRCGIAWFSPDCTYFSKAKGGKPFRDQRKARKVRGLIGVVLKWASNPVTRPRTIYIENVEEIEFWCPLGDDGRPDPLKRGASFRRWVARLRAFGYAVEWRSLRGCDYGAPTTRKRLFIIARCDGRPIVWPVPTHGRHTRRPVRTAAECIDFSLPVPSIFLTPAEAKAWALAHGVETPKRPLAPNTMRRIARGIYKFVLTSADPFIVPVVHQGDTRVHSVHEPMRTIVASDREFAIVTPTLIRTAHGERDGNGKKRGRGEHALTEPIPTVTGSNDFALVAPTLIQVGYGERTGQAPRILDIQAPLGTIVGGGGKHALVAAFLAKHNGGHEATGQRLERPTDAITTRDQKALVTSHLLKLYGTCQAGASIEDPMPVVTAYGNHIAEVRAFLVKFYGTAIGKPLGLPLDVVTTRERFGLVIVTIAGDDYVLVDIGMRMLTPRELFRAQGFPEHYIIDIDVEKTVGGKVKRTVMKPLTKKAQTRLCGNSVNPQIPAALIAANEAPATRRALWEVEATA